MPGLARLMREKRALWGDAHVNECWRRGVVLREPGWLFAIEGALAIGTPDDDARLAWFASLGRPSWVSGTGSKRAEVVTPDMVLLDMREPETHRGAH